MLRKEFTFFPGLILILSLTIFASKGFCEENKSPSKTNESDNWIKEAIERQKDLGRQLKEIGKGETSRTWEELEIKREFDKPSSIEPTQRMQEDHELSAMKVFLSEDAKRLKSIVDQGLKLYPKSATLWTYLTAYYVMISTGPPSEIPAEIKTAALKAAKMALDLDPSDVRRKNLAWVHLRILGDCSSAAQHYDKRKEKIEKEASSSDYYIARCYEDVGELDKAVIFYERFLKTTKNHAWMQNVDARLQKIESRRSGGQK